MSTPSRGAVIATRLVGCVAVWLLVMFMTRSPAFPSPSSTADTLEFKMKVLGRAGHRSEQAYPDGVSTNHIKELHGLPRYTFNLKKTSSTFALDQPSVIHILESVCKNAFYTSRRTRQIIQFTLPLFFSLSSTVLAGCCVHGQRGDSVWSDYVLSMFLLLCMSRVGSAKAMFLLIL